MALSTKDMLLEAYEIAKKNKDTTSMTTIALEIEKLTPKG